MGILQEQQGKPSMSRWLALASMIVGTGMIVAGLVGWFKGLPNGPTIIGTGAGIAFGGSVSKAIQKRWEV